MCAQDIDQWVRSFIGKFADRLLEISWVRIVSWVTQILCLRYLGLPQLQRVMV